MALQEEFEKQGLWLFRYRGSLPILLLVIGTLMYVRTVLYPNHFILTGGPYETYYGYFCILVSLLGLYIRVITIGFVPKNTSGRNVAIQVADQLNTSGMYSVVRHPLYLGNFFMWLGPALMCGQLWFIIAFVLVYWLYYERIMFAEEQFLRGKFGDEYLQWSLRVPAFIPALSKYKKSNLNFSWRKVLRQEKNGLVAIFLIFGFFNVLKVYFSKNEEFNFLLIGLAVFSFILYLILKYLKKYTSLLQDKGR
ncbi:MAG: DUF1295 domain-containing protein [Saprospiraceae bacterium]|nr:DUF1295 domain-containing protein [Saprospiraceae bacterium]